MREASIRLLMVVVVLAVPAVSRAQVSEAQHQQDLSTAHSVVQKSGIATLAVTGALGVVLVVNHDTLFGDGRCTKGDPLFGSFGCAGLSVVHLAFAVTSAVLFVTSEILAETMQPNPYYVGTTEAMNTMQALRWTNVGLFIAQPVLGLIAAHPGLIGVKPDDRAMVSRVLRTVHLGVGLGLATTYTVNAAMQW